MRETVFAAAQTIPVKGQISKNIENHTALIEKAAGSGARFIVFPELSLTGYEPELAASCAMELDDSRLRPFDEMSKRHGMVIVVGAPLKRNNANPYIGSFVFEPDNKPWIYTKHFLHDGEENYFSSGSKNRMIEIGGEKIALAVCADIVHPEHAQKAAQAGATVYAAGVLISTGGYDADIRLLKQNAMSHRMAVLMANFGAPSGGWESAGKSLFFDPVGIKLVAAAKSGEQLLLATRTDDGWLPRVV